MAAGTKKVQNTQKPFKLRIPDLTDTTDQLLDYLAERSKTMPNRKAWDFGSYEGGKHGPKPEGHYGELLFLAHDIEYMDLAHPYYYGLYKLIWNDAPSDISGDAGYDLDNKQPSPEMNIWYLMITWVMCEHVKNEFARMLYARARHISGLKGDKILLLNYPDSDIWSDEERLALKFIKAAVTFQMTDELFEAARQAWGEKLIFRYIALCNWYIGYAMTIAAVGVDRWSNISADAPLSIDRADGGWVPQR